MSLPARFNDAWKSHSWSSMELFMYLPKPVGLHVTRQKPKVWDMTFLFSLLFRDALNMSTKLSMSTSFPRFVDILRPTKNVLEPPLFLLRSNTSALFLWVPASFITITFDLKERLVVNRSPAFFDYLLKCVDLINISHNTFVQCLEYCIPKSFFIIRSFLPDFARSAFLSLF